MFKWLFSKKFKKENKIDRLISEYNLEFLINNLLKKVLLIQNIFR